MESITKSLLVERHPSPPPQAPYLCDSRAQELYELLPAGSLQDGYSQSIPGPLYSQAPARSTPWPLLPSVPAYYQGYGYPPLQAPVSRQRTAIACKYCRKRKIRCSGYDSVLDGRCRNCARFSQECLFHPASSQKTFVLASAVYGPNGVGRGQPQQLYGAYGQPLGSIASQGAPNCQYLPPGQYPSRSYSPAGGQPDAQQQGPPPQGQGYTQFSEGEKSNVRKRGPPGDDPYNEGAHASSQSNHPSSRLRTSIYGPQSNSNGGYKHDGGASVSQAGSTMTYQFQPGWLRMAHLAASSIMRSVPPFKEM